MTAEEKRKIMALLENIATTIHDYTYFSAFRASGVINAALKIWPVIPGKMGEDLKIREEG